MGVMKQSPLRVNVLGDDTIGLEALSCERVLSRAE
jgi:hypothetical protein